MSPLGSGKPQVMVSLQEEADVVNNMMYFPHNTTAHVGWGMYDMTCFDFD